MKATEIPTPFRSEDILPGFQFADSYAVAAPAGMDAIAAKERIIAGTPRWVNALMQLRNAIVGLAGLKTAPISQFPVISETPEQVMMGFDDSHLDFRIVVLRQAEQLSITTVVRTHNWVGRTYLRLILPFHRLIARRMIERVWA